jgi:hypothetical protein
MSQGKCGAHHYGNIDQAKKDAIIHALKASGATVTGNNPWNVDTHKYGIKLQGTWDQASSTLTVIVTAKDFFVPCSKIWDTIDSLIHHIQEIPESEMEEILDTMSV